MQGENSMSSGVKRFDLNHADQNSGFSLFSTYLHQHSTPANPIVTVRGTHPDGTRFEETIHLNGIVLENASPMEVLAKTSYKLAAGIKEDVTDLLEAMARAGSFTDTSEKINFSQALKDFADKHRNSEIGELLRVERLVQDLLKT
ncbi:MAG: hypothetical protein FWG63_08175 [Defluviitaleaceae bacterium]|nr:hypothetical protein [Defluviitaleaceae bacterium]